MSNDCVKLEAFTKKYGDKIACNSVDFIAGKNSITGLLGPNGAGKTTLIKTVCGEIYPTSGSVNLFGETDPDRIKKITGYVPETPELEEKLTVKETLWLQAKLYSVESVERAVNQAVETCDLKEVLGTKVKKLSKGFKQRVSLAKALCIEPKVLVLDEFSAGLDPSQTVQLRKRIKKIAENTTIIFSTHHIDEAVSLCDSIFILNKGNLVAHGTTESIVKETSCKNLEEAFLKLIEGEGSNE
ncbi:ABC transporter ATP-binding protein [Treponema sp.]|uniref:ABC transporter ATP-binding protein n=1 Tax=Treponema sp. TaxID=166 RepID=UPI00298DA7A9|nr:ABC transporter ATP-binding protein [Treponema sp.]MCQ2241477.1 ABC transporter ATP-binding protein [Treponema sp.]